MLNSMNKVEDMNVLQIMSAAFSGPTIKVTFITQKMAEYPGELLLDM